MTRVSVNIILCRILYIYTRTKKKCRVSFTDSFKVFNVMLHSFFLFLHNLSSLLNKLTKFHLIFSDNYEKTYHSEQDINLTDIHYSRPSNNIGIKHGFSCINIRQVPWEVLKTEAEGRDFQHLPRDLANINALKNHVRSLLLHKI